LTTHEDSIQLNNSDTPEFDQWLWVDYWYPLEEVIYFKRKVYENALRELQPLLVTRQETSYKGKRLSSERAIR
jgi:putative (di)nucleoside polyphosphate hydrolase